MSKSGVEWMKRNGWETLEESAAAHASHVLVGLYVEKCIRDDDEIEGGM